TTDDTVVDTADAQPDAPGPCVDPDNDGYGDGTGQCALQGIDCAPNDPMRFPSARELCNDLDDDCDNEVDEDFDLTSDLANCGMCGNTCDATGGVATCDAGTCGVSMCDAGFYDIDGNPTN